MGAGAGGVDFAGKRRRLADAYIIPMAARTLAMFGGRRFKRSVIDRATRVA